MTDADFLIWLASPGAILTTLIEIDDVDVGGVATDFFLSNRPYVTSPSDSPSNKFYLPIITGGLRIRQSLSITGPARTVSGGDVEFDNTGGAQDAWLGYVWGNRNARVYMGDPRWPRADFRLMYSGVVGERASQDEGTINLPLLDKLDRLNNPITETLIGGTGPNKDRLIPLTFGECHNVEPVLITVANNRHQYHNGAVEGVIEARYAGAPLTVAITQQVGSGAFQPNDAISGQLCASVQGDKPGGTYTNQIAAIVQRIATAYGPSSQRFDSGDLDAASLSAFAAANTQPVGVYISDRRNQLEVMQELADSVGAQVVCTSQGLLRLVKVDLPPPGTPKIATADDFEQDSLRIVASTEVVAAVKLGYCKNWTVQQTLATGLPAQSQALFREEWLVVTATDSAVATLHRLGVEPVQQNTLLLKTTDATTEANRRLDLFSVQRDVYQALYSPQWLLTELGDPITLNHERFNLGSITGMVVDMETDYLEGWSTIGVLA